MLALREPTPTEPPGALERTLRPEARVTDGGGWLVCRACGAFVAEARARIEVDGSHAHSFINPEGAIYRVGCFAAAAGAVPWGEPSRYFTWFAGFEWRVAGCRGCRTHLGWLYTAGLASFAGLILDRLVERPAAGPDAS